MGTGAPYTDQEIFELLRKELFTAVVGDILDKMGFLHQFLPAEIKPLQKHMVLAGRAMTVLEADVFVEQCEDGKGPLSGRSFGLMLEALDDLKENEIYVATGGSPKYALWGELMTTRAKWLNSAGALLDGYVRDEDGIVNLDFPTFGRGIYAQDQGARGKVIDYRVPIEIGGVRVDPGSLIFGDREGVLVIPREVEDEVIRRALEKVRGEKRVAEAIAGGMSASEAFTKFGIM